MKHSHALATMSLALAFFAQLPAALAQHHDAVDAGAHALHETLAHATSVHVTGGTAAAHDVDGAARVAAIVAALGADQVPTAAMSRCLTPYTLAFRDASHATIATVGLCDAPGLLPANRADARLDAPGAPPRGLTVRDLAALRAALRPAGVELP